MRRSLPIALVVVLMLVTANQSLASLSIVADLDSNVTNGPDTLQIEPTDTVLVRLWFTGTDSIISYGVAVGDTTGALSWVPDTAAVYNSPSGWTDATVYQDSLGWILLQATDFTFATHIDPPYEFARLKFYVTPGDSCGTPEADLSLCGWFNLDLGPGTFKGFEKPMVCVDSVLEGEEDGGGGGEQDEPGGGGEGNEPDAPPVVGYPCESDLIEVMFSWDSRVRVRDGTLVDLETDALAGLDSLLDPLGDYSWIRSTAVPERVLDSLNETAESRLRREVYNLNNAYRLRAQGIQNPWELSQELERLPGIHRAAPVPLAPARPTVGDYESQQGYLDSAGASPAGVNARYSWTQTGGTGSGVTVCDVEGCWHYNHADLSKATGSQINPNAIPEALCSNMDIYHGTSTLGILVSDNNEWGTTGICHDANLFTCSDLQADSTWTPVDAILTAICSLEAGDVLLLEEQYTYQNYMIPIEWYLDTPPDSQLKTKYTAQS